MARGDILVDTDFTLELQALREKAILNLTGASDMEVRLVKPSGEAVDLTPIVTNAAQGIAEVAVTAVVNDETGPWSGRWTGVAGDGSAIAGKLPSFFVKAL